MVTCGASGTISPTISKQTMPSPSLDPTTSIPTSFKVWTISTRNFGSIWIVERGMELFLKRSGRLGSGGSERPTGFIAINSLARQSCRTSTGSTAPPFYLGQKPPTSPTMPIMCSPLPYVHIIVYLISIIHCFYSIIYCYKVIKVIDNTGKCKCILYMHSIGEYNIRVII